MIERVLIVGLGGWRLAALLVYEDGPFDAFARLRRLAGLEREGEQPRMAKLLSCVWCTSVYTTTALWAAWELHWMAAAIPAAWAVAVATERWARP